MTSTDRRLFDLRAIHNAITQFIWMNDDGLHDDGLGYDEYMAMIGVLRALPDFKKRLEGLRDMGVEPI
jgi:hypothetical protein